MATNQTVHEQFGFGSPNIRLEFGSIVNKPNSSLKKRFEYLNEPNSNYIMFGSLAREQFETDTK